MEKLKFYWEELNASFWFIPIMMLMISIVAAIGLIYLDNIVNYSPEGMSRYIFAGGVDSARSILTIIAGAMIGIAGTVFSITLVALTLASSQLGSRLLRNFMYDRLNQVVLGTYVSAFAYSLVVSNTLTHTDDLTIVPVISVFGALLIALAGIILLIVFIHHISVSIQSNKVVSNISESLSKNIQKLFPQDIGDEAEKSPPDIESLRVIYKETEKIKCTRNGYLQSVNSDKIMKHAEQEDVIIVLKYRPGDYLVKDMTICEILCYKKCREDMATQINKSLILGTARTPSQDAEFAIHQMVEIASRALSPGVNDPYTAIACIDNLTSVMCYLARARFPSPYRYDEKGHLRLIADSLTFKGMLNASFNQIRQYAGENPAVLIRLMEALITINEFAKDYQQKKDIHKHAEMVMHAAEEFFHEQSDLEDIRRRLGRLQAV